jgi:hypothetical protein
VNFISISHHDFLVCSTILFYVPPQLVFILMRKLKLRSVPKSLAVRAVIALLATRKLVTAMRGRRPETLSAQQRAVAVGELRRLVPAPRPRDLGGERIGTDTYERFLSVTARLLV